MTKRRRKKRKLKYKNIIIAICIIIILIAGISLLIKKTLLNNKPQKEKEIEIKQPQQEEKKEEENLNRVTYKEGFYYEDIGKDLKEKITGCSYPEEFDEKYTSISYDDLKYIKIKHYDFNDEIKEGEMIVHSKVAQEVVEIFYKLYEAKYPIEKMNLVEKYNCEDEQSMQDNNTSAFNYRILEDNPKLSWHAFGLAIDINPLYNPYVLGDKIYPSTAQKYTDRTLNIKGLIDHEDTAYQIFKSYGWSWGGDFKNTKDYQHFFKTEVLDEEVRERKE